MTEIRNTVNITIGNRQGFLVEPRQAVLPEQNDGCQDSPLHQANLPMCRFSADRKFSSLKLAPSYIRKW